MAIPGDMRTCSTARVGVLLGTAKCCEPHSLRERFHDVNFSNTQLGDGFKYFLCSSLFGEDFQFD